MQAATVCVFFHQAQAKNKQRFSYFWYQSIISGVLMYYFSIRPCGCMGCGCNTNYLYFGWNDAVCHLQIAIQSLQMGVMVNDGKTCLCVCVPMCVSVSLSCCLLKGLLWGISSCQLKMLMSVFQWNQTEDISIRPTKARHGFQTKG